MRLTRIRAITAAVALGLSVTPLVLAAAASAADDVVEWATTDGEPVKIATTSADQKAHVFFTGSAGRHLIVSCDPGTTASSYVIQRADGSELKKSKCDAHKPLDFDPFRDSGRLRMLFTGENGQPFSATIKVLMIEDVTGTVTPGGAPLTLAAAKPEQNLSFALPLRAGQRVQMMCQSTATPWIMMVDPRGKAVEEDFKAFARCGSSDPDEAGLYTAGEAGTYRFVIYPGSRGRTYSATVSAVSTLPDVTAELATDGTPVTLATTVAYQRVKATFSLQADTRVYITCERKGNAFTLAWLYKPRYYGQVLDGCQDDGPGGEPTFFNGLLQAGTSTILINPGGENTDEFTLRVHTVPAPVTAELPLDGTPVTLETTTPGQVAQVTVKAEGGERVWIGCRLGSHRAPMRWTDTDRARVGFTQPGGQILAQGACNAAEDSPYNDYPSAFSSSSRYTATMTKAGTHTLTVAMNTAETNTVTLWAYRIPGNVEATAAADGVPVTVETTVPGQQAHVRFTGVAGSRYTLSCDVTGSSRTGTVWLTSPSGKQVDLTHCSPTGKITTSPLTESGDFRLEFFFAKDGTGKAALAVTPAG
ncbi:hypothetical protein [Actinoplanes regularis]|uniref:Uncharacterized protein n=1 Tax=Actinoplanes regularis TaxID=52697 RepID=A0A239IKM5_9ACTN|nr:hypothetical protein [Actinoplanes regularis]GIE91542.1 hypothetical protein Are01nite_80220 [Actinoplanes regularis]SNS92964.1 hypothetical protein SAMN06264365_12923 [Actinoplanes regularis]